MELQIQNEKMDIKRSIGNKKKTITIEKDFILPDSKPDIIKVQHESPTVYISKKENLENKVKIEGGVTTRVTYLTGEGKCRILKIDDIFAEIIEIEGMTESSFTSEKIKVLNLETNILNERKIHYRLELECEVKASKKENIEFIHEINPIHQLQVLKKNVNAKFFVGHGETRINLNEKLEIENLQENIEIIKLDYSINNVEKKISYNKILIKADCTIKCLYTTEAGIVYITKKDVPIMGFLDIENVDEKNDCNIEYSLRKLSIIENEKEINPTIGIEMEFNVYGDIYKTKEINVIQDAYCLNNKIDYTKQKVIIEDNAKNEIKKDIIKSKIILEDVNQIYDTECKIINYEITGKYIEGEIKLVYLYSSFENPTINKKEEITKFQIQLEKEIEKSKLTIEDIRSNILPDSSIETDIDISIFSDELEQNEIELLKDITIGEELDENDYSMVVYFVKPNDSLWKIAKKFKSTVNDITTVNEILDEEKIQVGDKLYIPRVI